ncbi:MAG TPA: hypothetical protein VFM25_06360 [Verrucomicrobiae bacterium]|nr:hypothetical protein [Verrucomicrobiae bacterium]
MKPTRARNTKAYSDLRCPGCGIDLTESTGGGFVRDNQTYCCEGCADGTGCTCELPAALVRRSNNRRGDRGQRNKENSWRDRNLGTRDTSGRPISKSRTGLPERRMRMVQPEISNPGYAHASAETRAETTREAHRRRKQIARLGRPARREKQTRRPALNH